MKRLVIKVGTAVLTQDGQLALERMNNLVKLIAKLKNEKKLEVILVSSGAVGAGCFCCAGGALLAHPAAAPLCARWLCVRSGSRYVGQHHAARCGTPGHGGHRGQWLRGGGAE